MFAHQDRRRSDPRPLSRLTPTHAPALVGLLALQRAAGNFAVAKLLNRQVDTEDLATSDSGPTENAEPLSNTGEFKWKIYNEAPTDGSPGGWKVASSYVVFRAFGAWPRNIQIDFEVGVPIVNSEQGYISDEFATSSSIFASMAAGKALVTWMRAIDPEGIMPAGKIEIEFRTLMEESLKNRISGARVNRPGTNKPK